MPLNRDVTAKPVLRDLTEVLGENVIEAHVHEPRKKPRGPWLRG